MRAKERPTTGGRLRLDVRQIAREGVLDGSDVLGVWTWSARGRPIGRVGFTGNRRELQLRYSVDGAPRAYAIALEWTACNYGGTQPWFRCPRCDRRAAVLYMVGGMFACRRCTGLAYESQSETRHTRMLRRRDRFRARLGAEPGIGPIEKPPRMHWRTFERLKAEAEAAEAESLLMLSAALDRMGNPLPDARAGLERYAAERRAERERHRRRR